MQRQELFFNKRAYEAHREEYSKVEKVLNQYLDQLKGLVKENFDKTEADKRIKALDAEKAGFNLFTGNWDTSGNQLREHLQSVVYDLLVSEDTLGGMKINKAKAFELVQMPDIEGIVDFVRNNSIRNDPQINFQIDIGKFTVKDGKAEKPANLDKELKEHHSIFAENERELYLYQTATKLRDEFVELNKTDAIDVNLLHKLPFLKVEVAREGEEPKISLNYDFIKK
ncbi:MAG: hypothetical protein K9I68_02455 [Bacteroidales bacterium]|nr:hypothetical protein [Bacteroidales bacterium]MCF8337175.1 hypothetical protein [Bacteroidales bacterium]